MLHEAIRASLETKLNNNTANKRFIVGSFAKTNDSDKDFVYNVQNGYMLVETNYIPVMMTWTCAYQAMPGQINGNAKLGLQLLVLADPERTDAEFQADLETLEEVVPQIVGNFESIVDGTKTYKTVWNMDALQPTGTVEFNGHWYVNVVTTVYVDFSDTNAYGNEFQYFINETQIKPYSVSIKRINEEDTPHALGDAESKGGNRTSGWTAELTVYIDEFVQELVDTFSSPLYEFDTIYKFSEVTPTRTTPLDISARLSSATYSPDLGEKAFATLVFFKSDEAYVEPEYTITYTLNGGTNHPSNPATFIYDDLPITLLAATKTGYTFNGWYLESGFTNLVTDFTTIGNKAVFAKFTQLTWVWEESTEEYWNLQTSENRGTSASLGAGEPSEDPESYNIGFAMRKLVSQEPDVYSYWKVVIDES